MQRLVREFVLDVRPAQNLLVLKTIVGSAQPVAAAIDEQEWEEMVGTIAGDDTILIICPHKDAAKKVAVGSRRCSADGGEDQKRGARSEWLFGDGVDAHS